MRNNGVGADGGNGIYLRSAASGSGGPPGFGDANILGINVFDGNAGAEFCVGTELVGQVNAVANVFDGTDCRTEHELEIGTCTEEVEIGREEAGSGVQANLNIASCLFP